ncbi:MULTISPECIES: hypothetical protein [Clostridium]|uniref:hypothetical protein n=1 Tax=Clostridium TaxID=1485 RepID=UPI001897411F|nr:MULTISPECIES: hypothetical protein [Clostridium]MCR1949741.1 hypothetical protein [Clostridium sp. DSM 100503]MDI9216117.1 hypothetical protein [Clostridium tertium]
MKRIKTLHLIVIVITIIQVCLLIFYKKDLSKEVVPCITEVKNVKYIKDIENEFNDVNNSTILSYNKIDESNWIVKCVLKGDKNEILDALNKLDDYYINNYNLNYDKENILLEMELKSK